MNKGVVFNIQRYSLHDGRGIRTNVFFKGCPLACTWCANPESQDPASSVAYDSTKCIGCGACEKVCPVGGVTLNETGVQIDKNSCEVCLSCVQKCPTHALFVEGEEYTVQELTDMVMKDKHYYDFSGGGVTVSGGEPLSQWEFVSEFLKGLQEKGVNTVVETCGYSEHLEDVIPYVDTFYFDVKHTDSYKHLQKTGKDNILILENLAKVLKSEKEVVVRIPIIPNFNDENAQEFIAVLRKMGVKNVHLLPFHNLATNKYRQLGIDYEFAKIPNMKKEHLQPMKELFKNAGFDVWIGG